MARRYHSSIAVATTIPGGTTDVATSLAIAAATGLPATYPYTMIIDDDTTTMEAVEVTNRSGTTLTVTRGVDGTTAQSHSAGATIHHGWTARDLDEPNAWINAGHDHSTTALGGAVPQASVTNLVSDLAAKAPSATVGLTLVAPASIANSGGSASVSGGQVTFTGVSSISLNGCFPGTYASFRVVATIVGSVSGSNLLRLRAAGTDYSGANYYQQYLRASAAAAIAGRDSTVTSWACYAGAGVSPVFVDLYAPNGAEQTLGLYHGAHNPAGGIEAHFQSFLLNTTTQYDGLSVVAASGTMTGKIRVYGYKNA